MGSSITALRATDSIEEADTKAKNNSCVNSFPALPVGTYFNLLLLQCTTSE